VEDGTFTPPPLGEVGRGLHEGSIGNLCTAEINTMMQQTISKFEFEKVHAAIDALLK
jgi:argininosuccinate lyase